MSSSPRRTYRRVKRDTCWASRRIRRLPLLSGVWGFAQILLPTVASFLLKRVLCASCESTLLLSVMFALAVLTVTAAYLGLALYFLIGDYTAWLRKTLFERSGVVVEPGRGHIVYKLGSLIGHVNVPGRELRLL